MIEEKKSSKEFLWPCQMQAGPLTAEGLKLKEEGSFGTGE